MSQPTQQAPRQVDKQAPQDNGGRRRRVSGCMLGCLFCGLIFVVTPIMVIAVLLLTAQQRVDAQLGDMRGNGEPVTLKELETRHQESVDEEQDLAELWIQACAEFDGAEFSALAEPLPVVGSNPDDLPLPGTPWDQLQEVEAFLQHYEQAMQALHQAADRGGSAVFPRDYADGFAMELPFLQQLRQGARMLRLEAYVQAHRGNADGVVRSLTTLAALARALEHENLLMGQFVRLALENIIVFTTFETLPEVDFTDDQLAELQEAFRGGSLKDGLHEALIGERVFAINAFNELNTVPRPEDLELTLQLSSRVIDNLDQPWPTVLQICDGVDAELAAKASSQLGQLRYPVSAMSFPALGHAATAMAAGEGQRAVADAALAAQRYRLKHGDYPKRLEDLVPEFLPAMPIDPLDGNHIRYALRDGFPVVWSIGIDREDDGGQGKLAYDRELDFVGRLAPAESGDTQDE